MYTNPNVFQFLSYKEFVLAILRVNGTRGQFRRLAHHLRVHPTLITLVFRGERHLTGEQAADLCTYFQMGELEADYFLTLVELSRAGREGLKIHLERRRLRLLKQANDIASQSQGEINLEGSLMAIVK